MKVEIQRKYWPATAKNDFDALDEGTVVDLPDAEAVPLVNSGVAKLIMQVPPAADAKAK